ncbi:AraC family transcriptional regulator [Exiguobacterium sp. SH3S2]|nr:AraC family transcriptional regulator [Exiguobacterium sp. SH3S3]TCI60959.1 AraC family transcriptional regulator [Exiguobacterium sp. SH3S2]
MKMLEQSSLQIVESTTGAVMTAMIHVTDHFHAFIVRAGRVDLMVNGDRHSLRTGSGLLLAPGQLYQVVSSEEATRFVDVRVDPYDLFAPLLAERFVTPFMTGATLPLKLLTPTERAEKAVLDTIDKVSRSLHGDSSFALLDATLQMAVVWRYWIQQTNEQTRLVGQDRMKAMLAYIHEHVTERVTLEQIAEAGGLSRAECCRYFTKWTGKSPLAYACDVRMEVAAHQLQETTESVAAIASHYGYTSVSHFVQTFKKVHKVTPLVYRKGKKTK